LSLSVLANTGDAFSSLSLTERSERVVFLHLKTVRRGWSGFVQIWLAISLQHRDRKTSIDSGGEAPMMAETLLSMLFNSKESESGMLHHAW
jgi:hypothetical protein